MHRFLAAFAEVLRGLRKEFIIKKPLSLSAMTTKLSGPRVPPGALKWFYFSKAEAQRLAAAETTRWRHILLGILGPEAKQDRCRGCLRCSARAMRSWSWRRGREIW